MDAQKLQAAHSCPAEALTFLAGVKFQTREAGGGTPRRGVVLGAPAAGRALGKVQHGPETLADLWVKSCASSASDRRVSELLWSEGRNTAEDPPSHLPPFSCDFIRAASAPLRGHVASLDPSFCSFNRSKCGEF